MYLSEGDTYVKTRRDREIERERRGAGLTKELFVRLRGTKDPQPSDQKL